MLTTEGEPVKVSSLKRGSVVKRSAPPRLQGSTLKAPLGRWGALARTSAMMSAPIGVLDAGFITKGHLRQQLCLIQNQCHFLRTALDVH